MDAFLEDEERAGRAAAERLCLSWPDGNWAPAQPSLAWARGAVEGFAEIVRRQYPIFRAGQKAAEKSASTLSPRPFQGLVETLQNADDLAATEVRIAYRNEPRAELLLAHDGRPVRLKDMGAMVIPWLSAKDDDDEASGRFGIGQKTLKALGDPIAMHCAPFHFEMQAESPVALAPATPIPNVYEPGRRDTMLVVPLHPGVESADVRTAVSDLGVGSLLFLKTVRRLTFVDLNTPEEIEAYELTTGASATFNLPFFEGELEALAVDLEVAAPAAEAGQRYRRYWARRPTPAGQERANKATGAVTPLGLAVARSSAGYGHLYDRVRMPVQVHFPVNLNAQFDPDGARSTVLPIDWNLHRFEDLGELLGSAAICQFSEYPAEGWFHVPLAAEVERAEGWLGERLRADVAGRCRQRLIATLQLPDLNGQHRPLADFVYEAAELDGLLTPEDQAALTDDAVVGADVRDSGGRWRRVLAELDLSRQLELTDAFGLFDLPERMQEREPRWFVSMAALAGRHKRFDDFLAKNSILLADGSIVQAPERGSPRVLVRGAAADSLAAQLGLAWPLHPAYLAEDEDAREALAQLKAAGVLLDACDQPMDALGLLARAPGSHPTPIRVADPELLALRDVWARTARDRQRGLAERAGRNIEIRVMHHVGRKPTAGWACPIDAYMPATIDKEADAFAKVAGTTPNLLWADPGYAKTLKHAGGRSEAGAQRFLSALGVARAPRLVMPENEQSEWARDTRSASAVAGVERPEAQRRVARGLGATHLMGDRWSHDLNAVVEDIRQGPAKVRRKRALGLLSLLARNWERRYAEFETAEAVSAYNGYWNRKGEVQATWLARLAGVAWVPNSANGYDEPAKLCLPTTANKLAHGTNRRAFLAQVPRHVEASGLLRSLGVQAGPTAADLLGRLQAHRGAVVTPERVQEVHTLYQLLAQALNDTSSDAAVGRAVTPQQLRNAFRRTGAGPGLVLAADGWHSPEAVFRGPPIFGTHRPFAPHIAGLETLWTTLQLPLPTAADCTAVLRELTVGSLSPTGKGIMLSTLRALAGLVDKMSPQLRTGLRLLPLWTGSGWSRTRPAYAFEGDGLADADIEGATVWRPGLTTLQGVEMLLPVLDVTPVRLEDFNPAKLTSAGVAEGSRYRNRFARAVALLAEELVRGDVGLHQSLTIGWDALQRAEFLLDPELQIETVAAGRSLRLPARAHVIPEPATFVAQSIEDAGDAQAGGQAIASLFRGDRQKVAWAWSAVWARASAGENVERIVLPQLQADAPNATMRLTQLQAQAEARGKAQTAEKGQVPHPKPALRPPPKIEVRQLRDLSELEPSAGIIINTGVQTDGVVFAKSRPNKSTRAFEKPSPPGGAPNKTLGQRTVLPPTNDRETLALDAIRRALRLEPEQFRDVRQRHGLGADAIDEMRHLYELKMESGPNFPSEVRLEASQVQAALEEPDFFLVLVAGLEDGEGALKVRFIFNPLQTLATKIQGGMTLTGTDKVEALEFVFGRAGWPSPT